MKNKKVLIVVDMQNDFVDGVLGSKEAVAIVPAVKERVAEALKEGYHIIMTRDTHFDSYMETEEGANLPVPHCIKDTKGWEIIPALTSFEDQADIIDKLTFGSDELAALLKKLDKEMGGSENARIKADAGIEEVELIGLCTDICVISNALLTKAALPNAHVKVRRECCAGVSPESHDTALEAMKACHIEIV
ncbi:cysteine hydrolase family protein [Butyrivibrio sp. MC2013]|uniref:cysteine hydrolase family protein n=1 Tax=Butyrivibrio sp. MC2013 TaxID=1280686 RepID=UPI00040A91D0|nr:isochorismatase family cysteine hydrolase [Butyrivibrio sp. MC2013]